MSRFTHLGAATLAALVLCVSFAAVSCGDEASDGGDNAAVISAISIMDKAGLHDIDTSISEKGEIPATARSTALKMQTVALLTEWPADLKKDAGAVAAAFGEMAAALDGEKPDLAKAGAAAKKGHDIQHDFSESVWNHLKGEAKVAGAEDDDHKK